MPTVLGRGESPGTAQQEPVKHHLLRAGHGSVHKAECIQKLKTQNTPSHLSRPQETT